MDDQGSSWVTYGSMLLLLSACGGNSSKGSEDKAASTGSGGTTATAASDATTATAASDAATVTAASGPTAATAASATTGSTGASGGATGSGGASSSLGSGGDSTGSGGHATGGEAGGGGAPAPGEACSTTDDCTLFADCCQCRAIEAGTTRGMCRLNCLQDACSAMGITDQDVACIAGRCVLNRACDNRGVTCRVAVPECLINEVPEVADDCYTGQCLPVDQCSRVSSCEVCEKAGLECVSLDARSYHCVEPVRGCDPADCECMGVCTPPYQCGNDGLSCFCTVC
jgi:hypothetical protein